MNTWIHYLTYNNEQKRVEKFNNAELVHEKANNHDVIRLEINGHRIHHVNNAEEDYDTILTALAAGHNLIDLTIVRTF